jgi:hypothetical protein
MLVQQVVPPIGMATASSPDTPFQRMLSRRNLDYSSRVMRLIDQVRDVGRVGADDPRGGR